MRFTAPEPAALTGGHHRRESTFDADTLLDFRHSGRGDSLGMLLASAASCDPLYLDRAGRLISPFAADWVACEWHRHQAHDRAASGQSSFPVQQSRLVEEWLFLANATPLCVTLDASRCRSAHVRPALCWCAGSLSSTPLVQGIIGAHLQRVSAQAALQQRSPSLDLQRLQGWRATALRRQSASAALSQRPPGGLKSGSWSQVGPCPCCCLVSGCTTGRASTKKSFYDAFLHLDSCCAKAILHGNWQGCVLVPACWTSFLDKI